MATTTRVGGTNVTTAAAARWSASLLSALISAMVGGAVWLLSMMAWFSAIPRTRVQQPLNVIATLAYGESALFVLSPAGYLWALAFHIGLAALWGMVFGVVATAIRVDKSAWAPLVLGVVVGLAAQIIDVNLLAPAVFGGLFGHDIWRENVSPAASWIAHVGFGLGFCVFPSVFRTLWLRFVGREDILAEDPRVS